MPNRLISMRFGLNGFSGSRAGSSRLNCSPICRLAPGSRTCSTLSRWPTQVVVDLVQRVVVALEFDRARPRASARVDPRLIGGREPRAAASPRPVLVSICFFTCSRSSREAGELRCWRDCSAGDSAAAGAHRRAQRLGLGLFFEVLDRVLWRVDSRVRPACMPRACSPASSAWPRQPSGPPSPVVAPGAAASTPAGAAAGSAWPSRARDLPLEHQLAVQVVVDRLRQRCRFCSGCSGSPACSPPSCVGQLAGIAHLVLLAACLSVSTQLAPGFLDLGFHERVRALRAALACPSGSRP